MMDAPQLTGLIQDLRRSTSRIEQLKVLTRAWKTVQGLSAAERVELAKHIGMREGLSLLERLGKPGGLSPAALAQAVVKAEQSSPGQLNQILRDLRTSSTRARGIRESVAMLDTVLEQEIATGKAPLGGGKPPRLNSTTPPPLPTSARRAISLVPEEVDSGPPAGAAEKVAVIEVKESLEESEAASETAPRQMEPAAAVTRDVRQPERETRDQDPSGSSVKPSRPSLEADHKPFYPETPSWGRPFRAIEDESTPYPAGPKATKATAGSSLVALRKLDRLIDTDPRLEERLEAVLSTLPPGWPRRRGLSRLIRSGAVSETAKILPAIASLENPFDEIWCLSAWLHTVEPSREELEAALRQTRSAAGKRLLRRWL